MHDLILLSYTPSHITCIYGSCKFWEIRQNLGGGEWDRPPPALRAGAREEGEHFHRPDLPSWGGGGQKALQVILKIYTQIVILRKWSKKQFIFKVKQEVGSEAGEEFCEKRNFEMNRSEAGENMLRKVFEVKQSKGCQGKKTPKWSKLHFLHPKFSIIQKQNQRESSLIPNPYVFRTILQQKRETFLKQNEKNTIMLETEIEWYEYSRTRNRHGGEC